MTSEFPVKLSHQPKTNIDRYCGGGPLAPSAVLTHILFRVAGRDEYWGIAIAFPPPRGMAELSFTRVQRGPRVARARRILSHLAYTPDSLNTCLVYDRFDKPIEQVSRRSPVAVPSSEEPGFSTRMRWWRRCPSPTVPAEPESRHGPLPPGCFGQESRTTRCPRIQS